MNNNKNKLEQLKAMTTIVADTGDINSIKKYAPTDATTNPSLILAAVKDPQYSHLIEEAVEYSKKQLHPNPKTLMMDKLFVNFGVEILKLIPGRVSTEVDARLSFDVEGSIQKAQALIRLYEKMGIDRSRVLIKLASTWEGAVAAKQLETMGIHCNMTLIFSLVQAIHCAEANVTLISPFVGRILDWYKKHDNVEGYAPEKDPGVLCVTQTYNYFKNFDYRTQVMGASFRNKEEILELAGCDLLTISPKFLEELQQSEGPVERKLSVAAAKELDIAPIYLNEKTFRLMLNEDAMATEKLAEGIRTFGKDAILLEKTVCTKYGL